MSKLMFRHGDVLLIECNTMPENLKRVNDKMLKAGEDSNHGHFVSGEGIDVFVDESKNKYVKVEGNNCSLRHLLIDAMSTKTEIWTGEHLDIKLPAGKTFQVISQVEYDPYEKAIRIVND